VGVALPWRRRLGQMGRAVDPRRIHRLRDDDRVSPTSMAIDEQMTSVRLLELERIRRVGGSAPPARSTDPAPTPIIPVAAPTNAGARTRWRAEPADGAHACPPPAWRVCGLGWTPSARHPRRPQGPDRRAASARARQASHHASLGARRRGRPLPRPTFGLRHQRWNKPIGRPVPRRWAVSLIVTIERSPLVAAATRWMLV
jgi:hypothetical protein